MSGPGAKQAQSAFRAQDTDPWAERILFDHWRSLDSVAKLRIVSEHSVALQHLSIAGLAARYPDDSEEDLELRAACLRIGRDVVERWTGRKLEW